MLGSATPYATQAYITGASTVTAGGNVSVFAEGQATITATVGDQAAAGNSDATATLNVGGLLATNKIDTATNAYIGTANPASTTASSSLDTSSVTATGGTVVVLATDSPTLSASSTMTLSSTASAGGVASALSGDYKYTEQSGTQTLHKGDQVRVNNGSTVKVYTYTGTDGSVDLSSLTQYTQTNPANWAPTKSDGSASGDSSSAESKALGFNFVLNDVRGEAFATIATIGLVTGGTGIVVNANEAASINADTESNLTSTGGGNGSQTVPAGSGSQAPDATTNTDAKNQPEEGHSTVTPGGGLALGGVVVTNLVLAQSQASIQGATLSAGTGGIIVNAEDTAQLNAKALVASSTGGAGSQKDFDLAVAFNSIGYAPENFLFNAVDALIGGDYLSNPTPDNATAYVSHVIISNNPANPASVGDLGGLTVTAESNEQVNATVSNAASATTSSLYDASSTGFGGILVSSKVNGSAIAFIDETGISGTANPINIDGALTVSATDNSAIYSNNKLVSSAIVTGDGGTGSLNSGGVNTGTAPAAGQTSAPATDADFMALGSGSTLFDNEQTIVSGDTVQLNADYDTPDYTVGAAGEGTVNLRSGDVIKDGSTLYRYNGSNADNFSLTNQAITTDTTDFKVVSGQNSGTYQYVGQNPQNPIDLANTNYNGPAWVLVTPATPVADLIQPGQNLVGANPPGCGPRRCGPGRSELHRCEPSSVRTSPMRTFSGAILIGANLSGANLSGANLTGAILATATLTGANLTDANLAGANLTSAILTRANLGDAILVNAKLDHANLAGADLTGATLIGASLVGAEPLWCDPHQCALRQCDPRRCKSQRYEPRQRKRYRHGLHRCEPKRCERRRCEPRRRRQHPSHVYGVGWRSDSELHQPGGPRHRQHRPARLKLRHADIHCRHRYHRRPCDRRRHQRWRDALSLVSEPVRTGSASLTATSPATRPLSDEDRRRRGRRYTYVGSGAPQVDLANTNYNDGSNWKLVPNSFTALAEGANPFSNTRTVNFGDTVTLNPGYATPDFTVGATGEGIVQLQNGDVIDDHGTLYRYGGAARNNFALGDGTAITTGPLAGDFHLVAGTGGATYQYMGASSNGTSIDLANTNYTNLGFWKLVTTNAAPAGVKTTPAPDNYTALGDLPGDFSNPKTLADGDTVTLDSNYDKPTYTIGTSNPTSTALNKGDVVADGDTLYRYTGSGASFDLKTDPGLASNSDFTAIGGDGGTTYVYGGSNTTTATDLANTDYTGSDWTVQPAATGGAENEGAASNDTPPPATPAPNASNATAVGGILVLNDDRSATHAYILNATITAATASVSAIDNATIEATNDSTVTAASSSLGSKSNNIALNGIIATNLIQNSATAEVNTSSITTTGAGPANTDGSPNAPVSLSIDAENNANISASNAASTSGTNKSAGIVLAFNTIGLQSSNFLFNAVDALLGNNVVTAAFGDSPQTNTTADAHDSTLTAEDGSISITALQVAKINATTTNSTTSLGTAVENASAVAIGAILATNQTNSFALAYADGGSTLSATGDVGIQASDRSEINAINTEVASAVLQTQATTKPSLFTGYLDQLKQGYQYTSDSGTQTISAGTIVYDDPLSDTTGLNGTYYVYLGSVDQHGLETGPMAVDLGATDYTIGLNAGQFLHNTPQAEWLEFTNSSLLADLPDFATVKATGDTKGTGSSSTAVGAIFVLNTINASVDAHASTSTLDSGVGATTGFGGGVTIQATNLSTINATNTSTVTASNGQTGPTVSSPGTGLAVNATIATNNILSSTQAYSSGGSITALGTGGSIDITATSNDSIDAENDATTDAKTTSVGVVLAFNTIGIKQPVAGFLENTVDALFGTSLAGEQPDQVYAYMSGTTANASDGIDVAATDSATITAKIDNAETGLFSSGTSVAATVTLNRIATDVEAWISGGSATATAGDIDITGLDAAAITSTVLSPVVKLAVDFSAQGSGPQNATTIGIGIARNIIDNTLDAEAGLAPTPYTSAGTTLHAEDGSINITANQTATIAATSASAAISVAANKSGNSGGFAGGGAVAINTITGGVVAESASSGLTASGAIGVNATYGGSITSTVAALAASLAASEGAADAVAIGAAVSLNLIGWRGTVADETQDSNNPITLSAKISGGSASAGTTLTVTADSTTSIEATTVAAAVAIAISAGSSGGGGGSQPTTGGTPTSPTDANVEGKGSNPDAEGQELSPTDSGASSTPTGLSMLDEGSDVKGSGGVNSTEQAGTAAGTSGGGSSTATKAQSSSTSTLSLTAAGVYTENKIATHVVASIENATSVSSGTGVSVHATDGAQINSLDGAAAVSADLSGGESATKAIAIGIGIARNTIQDSVDAHILGSTVTGSGAPLSVLATEEDSIVSTSLAAALAISVSTGSSSLGVAGGGSLADNLIGVSTTAYVSSSTLGVLPTTSPVTAGVPIGSVTVEASDTSSIDATVAAVAATVSISGGSSGTGVAIGVSLAHNRISDGTDLGGNGSVNAYIATSNIDAGAITVGATSQQTISALTAAAAVAVSGGDQSGLGVSGAGAIALNEINLAVNASIDGSATDVAGLPGATTTATDTIISTGVSVTASDSSSIDALVAAGAVSGGFGGESGFAVAIGVSFARNAITNPVNADITNVKSLTTSGGAVVVTATEAAQIDAETFAAAVSVAGGGTTGGAIAGGGAIAWNIIGVDTTANITGSTISNAGDVLVTAVDSSSINAQVAAVAAAVGIGGTTGVGVALGVSLAENEIDAGGGSGSGVLTASIVNSSIASSGAVDVEAYSTQSIVADTLAGAVAISGGGTTGVAVAGAGVFVENLITLGITADISGTGSQTITAGRVAVDAYDQAQISAVDGAAAVSASFAGEGAVSVAIGLSIAQNTINDPVSAYINGVSVPNATVTTAQNRTLQDGDLVNLPNGTVFEYIGTGNPQTLDLASQVYTTSPNWKQVGFVTGAGTQTVSVAAGDTVTIGGNITPTYQSTHGQTTLNTFNTVENAKGVVYEYLGPSGKTIDLSDQDTSNTANSKSADYSDTSTWLRLASAGDVYTYVGASTSFDINSQNYSNTAVWLPVNTTVPAGDTTTGVKGAAPQLVALVSQDSTVTLGTAYTTATYKSSQGPEIFTASGTVVQSANGTLYKYVGTLNVPVDLSATNFGNAQLWTRVPSPGDVYRYVGSTSASVDINNQDYTNTGVWQLVAPSSLVQTGYTNAAPQATNPQNNVLIFGDTVTLTGSYAAGTHTGDVYRYVGQEQTLDINNQNYATSPNWQKVSAGTTPATYIVSGQTTEMQVIATENASIKSISVAAALSIAGGGGAGVGVAGGGSTALNQITAKTDAYIQNSQLGSVGTPLAGGVTVLATDSSQITATEVVIAASVAIGGDVGVGVAIGVAVAENTINNGSSSQGEVEAYVTTSSVWANGLLDVEATSSEHVDAEVIAVSAAISGGGNGVALAGAGTTVINSINVMTKADIDGGISSTPTSNIVAGAVKVIASDVAVIDAEADAASVSAAFGAGVGFAGAIGLAIAENTIIDPVTAVISNVPLLTIVANPTAPIGIRGSVSVSATENATIIANAHALAVAIAGSGSAAVAVSAGGAVAENEIGTQTNADIMSSSLGTASNTRLGAVTVTAIDSSYIKSDVLAAAASVAIGGDAGVGAAIGISVARNVIGDGSDSVSTSNETQPGTGLTTGAGQVQAEVNSSNVYSTGLLDVVAQSNETISADILAVSVAIGGGTAGVAVAAGGTWVDNQTDVATSALIVGDGTNTVNTGAVTVEADDTATIDAQALAGALSAGFGAVGVAVSIGISIAANTISDPVTAGIENVAHLNTGSGLVQVNANEDATINAQVAAVAVAISGGGLGISISGGGAFAENTINVNTSAIISGSSLGDTTSVGAVTVAAMDNANITADVFAAARLPSRFPAA